MLVVFAIRVIVLVVVSVGQLSYELDGASVRVTCRWGWLSSSEKAADPCPEGITVEAAVLLLRSSSDTAALFGLWCRFLEITLVWVISGRSILTAFLCSKSFGIANAVPERRAAALKTVAICMLEK